VRKIYIRNISTLAAIPEGLLKLEPDSYHLASTAKTISFKEDTYVDLKCYVNTGATIEKLPKFYTLTFSYPGYTVSKKFETCVVDYTGEFLQAKPYSKSNAENLNILVFGWAGSTKSSFVNSVFTLLHDSDILQPAIVGGGMDHTTKELTKYQLKHGDTELKVSFWDTWGLTFQTYKGDEIRGIVNGVLPEDWKMKDLIINKQEEIRQSEESKNLREIHAILFFFPTSCTQ